MLSAFQQLPMLVHLLRPDSQHKVNVPKLLLMLKPNFSEAASNTLRYEKDVCKICERSCKWQTVVWRETVWGLQQVL